jgi:DNA polymerase V
MSAVVYAGFPSPANEYMDVKLDLNSHLVKHPAATFFVRVVGNSMVGAGIHSGDILIVDRSLNPENTRVVIAEINGELAVRRVLEENGKLRLVTDDGQESEQPPEIPFEIWGVVAHVIHPL